MEKNLGKRLIIFAFSILMSLVAFGQQTRVSGTVTDAADGSTLPGVNVTVKGTLTGSITGTNGEYSLMAQPGDVLVFTFIGYLPQEVTLGAQAVLNVAMRTDVQALDEVVVIGYGTVRKEDATGSVKAVNSEYFNPGIVSSPQNMVIGKMAGVQITTGGGAPGDGATIRIRGGSSLNASNDPLIVIDGVAVDIIGVSGMRNPLSTINPNDIETFTVLKDASATAIYGSRASNGVILITTKKGASGKPFSINYTGSVSVSNPFNYVDVFNAEEFSAIINDKYGSDPGVTSLLGESDTDWQKEIYRTAISYDNNLNFTGGLGNFPYRVSIGYTDQDGILDTDNLKRVTGSVNISPTLFDDHLKIELNAKGMINNNTFANTGAIGGATSMDPTQATDFVWLDTNGNPDFNATMNPLIQLSDYHDVSDVNRLIGNLMLDYKMHFFPALRAKLNLGLDKSNSEGTVEIPVGSQLDYSNYEGKGRLTEYNEHKTTSLLDFYFDYTGEFGDHSRLNAIAGYSWQHFYRDGMTYTATVTDEVVKADNDYKTESFLVSFFGRINYVLLDRYLFTFTLRDDGSSKFSPENRWGLFPSAAFAWNISKEGFFGDNAVSNLKLRLGYGVTGQQNLTSNDYPYQAIYMFHEPGGYVQFGDRYVQPVRPSGYDANLKWEETATYNIGLDYGFLKDRITGDIDVYLRKTSDLINEIPVPAGTNLSNRIVTNVGNLENRGIEFSINAKAVAATNVDWEIGFNATYNENKITKLTVVDDPDYQGIYTGGIGGGTGNTIQIHSVGYPQSSFFVMEQVYNADGKPIENLYVDNDNSGTITTSDDKYRYKKPAPDVFMGFSSLFRYKNLDFSFSGRINVGNYVYNNINSGLGTYAYMAATGRYLNNRVRNVEYTNFENPQYWSDYYIENASFMKLDNASLGYNFNNLLNDKLDLRVYCTAENLFTVTKYTGLDPEIFSGIDNNLYPRPRTFMFGISLTL